MTEDEMAGWHHPFNGHEIGQTPGGGERQGMLQSMRLQRVRYNLATEQQQRMKINDQNGFEWKNTISLFDTQCRGACVLSHLVTSDSFRRHGL